MLRSALRCFSGARKKVECFLLAAASDASVSFAIIWQRGEWI
jgi:hypothetical protein